MPSWARTVAHDSLALVENNPVFRQSQLITCRVFTAFMVEGVVAFIGSELDTNWSSPNRRNKSPEEESLAFKNNVVRKLIGLSIGDQDHQESSLLCKELKGFRDVFVHPKQIKAPSRIITMETAPTEGLFEWSKHSWEALLEIDSTRSVLDRSESYCRKLLDTAISDVEINPSKYPHIIENSDTLTGLATLMDISKRGHGATFKMPQIDQVPSG